MGTNYYLRHNICSCCGRYDEQHICKSLVSFEGVFHEITIGGEYRDVPDIASWADWKERISADGVEVWDEYRVRHYAADFIARVEATEPAARRRQYDWCATHGLPVDAIERRQTWLDADGFSFYGGDFS